MVEKNDEALLWRLAMIDSAEYSLDVQYYLWYTDDSGELLFRHLIAAANRGVRVRFLIDDINADWRRGNEKVRLGVVLVLLAARGVGAFALLQSAETDAR